MDPLVVSAVPAASVLLVSDAPLKVLMVRRGANAIFPSTLVFPGGVVDPQDASDEWLPYVSGAEGIEAVERSYRIAACRELFEEADVLLCDKVKSKAAGHRTYLDEIKAAGARIPLDDLIPFGHWITPEGLHKRFDTHFYFCRAPLLTAARADGREVVTVEWMEPKDVIERARSSDATIMFPTLSNLMRLAESRDVDTALSAAKMRPAFVVLPRIERRGNSQFVVIPAAAGYSITEREHS